MKVEPNSKSALAASDSRLESDSKSKYKQRILETFDSAAKEYGTKGNEFFDLFAGTLAISTWGAKDPKAARLAEVFQSHGIDPKVQLHSFDKEAFIAEKLQEAGFKAIQSERVKVICSYESFDAWFDMLWTHASRAVLTKCTSQILNDVKSQFREYEGKFQVTLEAILTTARK